MDRIILIRNGEALGENNLKDVPCLDEFLRVDDSLLEGFAGEVARHGKPIGHRSRLKGRHPGGGGQLSEHPADAPHGLASRFLDPEFTREGASHNLDPTIFVVEEDHGVGNQENHVGKTQIILGMGTHRRLEAAHGIVAQIPHGSTGEAG